MRDSEVLRALKHAENRDPGYAYAQRNGCYVICTCLNSASQPAGQVTDGGTVLWQMFSKFRARTVTLNCSARNSRLTFDDAPSDVRDGSIVGLELTVGSHGGNGGVRVDRQDRSFSVRARGYDEFHSVVQTADWPVIRLQVKAKLGGVANRNRPGLRPPTGRVLDREDGLPKAPQTVQQLVSRIPSGKLRIVSFCTEWESGRGGLSTFNRKLCNALADQGHDVYLRICRTSGASGDQEEYCQLRRVDGGTWRPEPSQHTYSQMDPHLVIGHDRITGQVMINETGRAFPGALTITIIHTDPQSSAWNDGDLASAGRSMQRKSREQLALLTASHISFAVGPRLYGHLRRMADGLDPRPHCHRVDPGFNVAALDPPTFVRGEDFRILLMARSNDVYLKGRQTAIDAVSDVRKKSASSSPLVAPGARISLALLGPSEEEAATLKRQHPDINVMPYTSVEGEVHQELLRSHLVLMPSFDEGFGLVALEALEANRPVLVTSQSGIAEYLLEECSESPVAALVGAFVVKDKGLSDLERVDMWSRRIGETVLSYDELTGAMQRLRAELGTRTWEAVAARFVQIVRNDVR